MLIKNNVTDKYKIAVWYPIMLCVHGKSHPDVYMCINICVCMLYMRVYIYVQMCVCVHMCKYVCKRVHSVCITNFYLLSGLCSLFMHVKKISQSKQNQALPLLLRSKTVIVVITSIRNIIINVQIFFTFHESVTALTHEGLWYNKGIKMKFIINMVKCEDKVLKCMY